MKKSIIIILSFIILPNGILYGQDKTYSFGKLTIGYKPTWNIGVSGFNERVGLEILASTSDNSAFEDNWNDRYGDSADATLFVIESNLLYAISENSAVEELKKGQLGLYGGAGITYKSLKGKIPSLGQDLKGNVWGFNLLFTILHKIEEKIYLDYRIGYRIFGKVSLEVEDNEFGTFKAEFSGDELNTFTLSAGINVAF